MGFINDHHHFPACRVAFDEGGFQRAQQTTRLTGRDLQLVTQDFEQRLWRQARVGDVDRLHRVGQLVQQHPA